MDISKVAKNLVKSVSSGEDVAIESFWEKQLIGIGLEELGVEEFVKGEFFKGELYIDMKKEAYKALGFKRLNIFSLIPSILGKKARAFLDRVKKEKIEGNMSGDGMQNGGALVVEKGGKMLLSFKQDSAADHVENEDVLKALGLSTEKTSNNDDISTQGAAGGVECKTDQCQE
ncbi:hypothetical protein ACF0H5_001145 [Mactra antiquata]